MAKAKYDVGDILTWCNDGDCYATAVIIRWHTKSKYLDEIILEQHTDYSLFIKAKEDDFKLICEAPETVLYNYKVVGHIDISDMSIEEIKKNLDCAIRFEYCDNRIAHAIEEHWIFYKVDNYCFFSVQDKLKYDLKMANEAKEELKKELDQLKRNYRCGKASAAYKLYEIGFTNDKIGEILGETPCVISYLLSGRVN